jgi:hypothetical protein
MVKNSWDVVLEGRRYRVEAQRSSLTGRRSVRVNGEQVEAGRNPFDLDSLYPFTIDGHSALLRVWTPNTITYELDVLVDGISLTTGTREGVRSGRRWQLERARRDPAGTAARAAAAALFVAVMRLALAGVGHQAVGTVAAQAAIFGAATFVLGFGAPSVQSRVFYSPAPQPAVDPAPPTLPAQPEAAPAPRRESRPYRLVNGEVVSADGRYKWDGSEWIPRSDEA